MKQHFCYPPFNEVVIRYFQINGYFLSKCSWLNLIKEGTGQRYGFNGSSTLNSLPSSAPNHPNNKFLRWYHVFTREYWFLV